MAHLRRPGLYPVPAWVLYSPYSLGKFLERPAATREDFGAPCCHTAVMLFVLNAVVGLARNFAGRVGNLCGYFGDLPIRPSERRFRPPAGPLHEQGKGLQALLTWMRATGVDHTTTPAKAGPDHLFLVATLLTDVVSLHMEFQNGMNYSEGHLHIGGKTTSKEGQESNALHMRPSDDAGDKVGHMPLSLGASSAPAG